MAIVPLTSAVKETALEVVVRLGVPTLLLVVLMTTVMPRLDRGIAIAERVDATMAVVASRCGYGM